MPATAARRDLREKLKFERMLMGELKFFNQQMARKTIQEYAQSGRSFHAAEMQPALADMLLNHYNRVGEPFSEQITDILPDGIQATETETNNILAALAAFFGGRAPEQAEIITGTNQRDIEASIDTAIMISQEDAAATGTPQSRVDIAVLAGAGLSRRLAGRVRGIAALETQAVAEAAKATEAQILTFQPPSVVGGSPRQVEVDKIWFTQGDERVRQAHMFADNQTVSLNSPFRVGGQDLRWPGDTSLGASVGNVVNCRCSSVVNTQEVFAVRRKRGESPFVESVATEELLTSIGDIVL